jgi:hypothetical protein
MSRATSQYGQRQASAFLEQILPAAPDVVVQIAHLAGAGGWDEATDDALMVFVRATREADPRTRNLYFDVSAVASPGREAVRRRANRQRSRAS